MSKKGKSETKTVTPTAPPWATAAAQAATNRIAGLANQNPANLVAGPDPLQVQAGQKAAALTGNKSDFDAAKTATNNFISQAAPQITGEQINGSIKDYLNPFFDNVLKSFDQQAGDTRAQQDLDLAGSGAFEGSFAPILKASTLGQLALARGNLQAQGFDAARQSAQNVAQANANLAANKQTANLTAAEQLANIAATQDQTQRADIASQLGVGSVLQGLANERAQLPLKIAALQAGSIPGLINPFFGQTGTATEQKSAAQTVGDLAQIAALFA